jgi:hypothetical protein
MSETQAEELLFQEINEPVAVQRHPVQHGEGAEADEWAETDESATDEI